MSLRFLQNLSLTATSVVLGKGSSSSHTRPRPPPLLLVKRKRALFLCIIVISLTILASTLFAGQSYESSQIAEEENGVHDERSPKQIRLMAILAPFAANHTHHENYRQASPRRRGDEDGACLSDPALPRSRRGMPEVRHGGAGLHRCVHRNTTSQSSLHSSSKKRTVSSSQCRPPVGYGLEFGRETAAAGAAVTSPFAKLLPNQSYTREFAHFLKKIPLVKEEVTLESHNSAIDCVVYTVVVGNYENNTLKPFAKQTESCFWVAFTDNVGSLTGAPGWISRSIPSHLLSDERRFLLKQHREYSMTKFVKMLPFLLFAASIKFAIFIDAMHSVTSATFVARTKIAVTAANAPMALLLHSKTSAISIADELDLAMRQHYDGIGTVDLLIKQVLAHVAEGMCDHWADLKEEETFTPTLPVSQLALNKLSPILRRAYCLQTPETFGLSTTMGRRFLHHKGKQRYPCRKRPPPHSALPQLPESLLQVAMPVGDSADGGSSSAVPMYDYDTSIIAFRLNHPHTPTRKFTEEFLKQWYRDSSFHGKDRLPLIMLLWRTPGYVPPLLDNITVL
ncbi:membrane-associated protein, putative [Bodo saltans]|uniref:Membrane-associated protein, putative n=1 Tax=Bodo saltans TaxID=75058 RepID=A0A0S4J096_BODSA|nr:membrane-associated protein, putative [Bodo saltans]|eukprot:CUG35868.1 membrane-associated protein, putative [Bodo saltans]